MAEFPRKIQRINGNMDTVKQPYGDRVLLPTELELCNLLNLSKEEYFYFVDQTFLHDGKQKKGYELIPNIQAGNVAAYFATDAGKQILVQIGLAIASATVAYLLTPKPKQLDNRAAINTADVIGAKRFAPQFAFDSIQELATIGDIVPLVFANQDINLEGGIRVNSQLLWSQLKSLGRLQRLSAKALFCLGNLAEAPDEKGFAIGDMLLENYHKQKFSLYFKKNGGRIKESDCYESNNNKKLPPVTDDPFLIPIIENHQVSNKPAFSSARNPNTQTTFGLYNPMPNASIFRPAYDLVRDVRGASKPAIRDIGRKRKKVEFSSFPMRAGFIVQPADGSLLSLRTVSVDDEIVYEILGGDSVGVQKDKNEKEQGFMPHGVVDITNSTKAVREASDSYISVGETYMLGTSIATCIDISSNSPFDNTFTKKYTFKVTEIDSNSNQLEKAGGLARHIDNPLFNPNGRVLENVSRLGGGGNNTIFIDQFLNNRDLADPVDVYHLQRLAIGTITNNRKCRITEIGLKSKVFKKINFVNVNSQPEASAIDKIFSEPGGQLNLGRIDKFINRFSFFKLYVRELGSETWDQLVNSTNTSQHTGLFCVRGNTPEFQYNFIKIQHPREDQFEYRLLPWPGRDVIRKIKGTNGSVKVNLLNANFTKENQDLVGFERNTIYGLFSVKFVGNDELTLDKETLTNPEFIIGNVPTDAETGEQTAGIKSLRITQHMSNNQSFQIPTSQEYVVADAALWGYFGNFGFNAANGTNIGSLTFFDIITRPDLVPPGFIRFDLWYRGTKLVSGQLIPAAQDIETIQVDIGNERFRATKVGGIAARVTHPETNSILNPVLQLYVERSVLQSKPVQPYINTEVSLTSNGAGTGAKVQLTSYTNGTDVASKFHITASGSGYKEGEIVTIPSQVAGGGNPNTPTITSGINLLSFADSIDNQPPEAHLNDFDAASDMYKYEGDQSSHLDEPEHQVVYVNEIIDEGTLTFPTYDNLAYAGIRINSSKEWTNFAQLSAYFKKGIVVESLLDNSTRSTSLFPEIVYALLTDSKIGAGEIIGANSVDKRKMVVAAKFCKANDFYWDGVISQKINLREFIFEHAGYNMLSFQIVGGRFSVYPDLPFECEQETSFIAHLNNTNEAAGITAIQNMDVSKFKINYEADIRSRVKCLYTDGNTRGMQVGFLNPQERQLFKGHVLYRKEKTNGFSEIDSDLYRFTNNFGGSENDPIERFDLSGFCTRKEHARTFVYYALKVRKEIDHTIQFETAPQYIENVGPGDLIKVISEVSHTDRFRNGAITPDGTVVTNEDGLSTSENIYYWQTGTEGIKTMNNVNLLSANHGVPAGSLFAIKSTTTENKIYKVQSITYGEEGLIAVSASFYPVNSSGKSKLLTGLLTSGELTEIE